MPFDPQQAMVPVAGSGDALPQSDALPQRDVQPHGEGLRSESTAEVLEGLATVAHGRDDEVEARCREMLARTSTGSFHVAVVGEFKRGKSTLLNALVGRRVLPSGVLPLTTVTTELRGGEGPPVVVALGGEERELGPGEGIADYVTEAANPGNVKGVARVVVPLGAPVVAKGLVLVDTPGVGSVHRHNDEEASAGLLDADGAIVVLSADAPLSERERELIRASRERHARTFYVLNKIDHLSAPELEEVRRFVEGVLEEELGHGERVWLVSARAALAAAERGEPPGDAAGEFGELAGELERFAAEELGHARGEATRREMGRLARVLAERLSMEEASARLGSEALAAAVERFEAAAGAERRAWRDQRDLLRRDVDALVDTVGSALRRFAAEEAGKCAAQLEEAVSGVKSTDLAQALDDAIEQLVRERFESFRQEESAGVERAWAELAASVRSGAEARVNSLRALAGSLFDVDLPPLRLPAMEEERERFFYLFIRTQTPLGQLASAAMRVLPGPVLRRRLLAQARVRVADELDKHAGRARWDLAQRMSGVRSRFEAELDRRIEDTVEAILDSARRARELKEAGEEEQLRCAAGRAEAMAVCERALRASAG